MMTNVMAATYPELFKAAAAQSGVAAGCFASANDVVDEWNDACATGKVSKTQEEWAAVVKAMGGSAPYPKMQLFHGSADDVLYPPNFQEEIKEWTGVFGLDEEPTSTETDTPEAGYTLTNYGEKVQGIFVDGAGHNLPDQNVLQMKWFGL
jgi:acetylxylan esterase